MTSTFSCKLALAGTVSLFALSAADAQEAPAYDLGTLVIYGDRTTAQADESNASVGIVAEDDLDDATLTTVRDGFGRIANVQQGDSTLTGFVIRGINSEGQTPGIGAPLASFYIDGVQQTTEGTRRGARGVFDAEQLEVYRGPQSTLTGRSALAGAVYLRTNDPEFENGGSARLTFGTDNRASAGLALNGVLSENLAFRLSGEWFKKDNPVDYPSYEGYSGYDDIAEDEFSTARGKLLWRPAGDDTTRVLFSFSRSNDNPVPSIVRAGTNRGDVNGELNSLYPVLAANGPALEFFGVPAAAQLGILTVLEEVRDTTVDNAGIEVTHEINEALSFTSMTGWSHSVTDIRSLNEGDTGEVTSASSEQDQTLFTQEFRLNHESDGLRWVAGAYYGREKRDNWRDGYYFNPGFLGDPTQPMFISIDQSSDVEVTNAALFGEVAWEFSPRWTLIAGGRVDHIAQDNTLTVSGATSDWDFEDTVLLGKLGIGYEFDNSDRMTLIVQDGYRPGGAGVTAAGQIYDFDAERSLATELSYRGRAMQGRLDYGVNVFWQHWDNQQVEIGMAPDTMIVNAGESVSWGGEIELGYAANDRLDLFGSVGLLHTELKDFNTGGNDFSGKAFPNAPELTAALGYQWGADTGWFSTGVVKYTGSQNSRFDNASPDRLGGYATVDLSVGYAWDAFKVTAYATNLFDEDYLIYENSASSLEAYGARREVGIQLDYTF